MRHLFHISTLVAASFTGVAVAQSAPVDLPAFQSTFSSATLTRGFFFQAPTNFTITGLRVPDEKGHGMQAVAVYKLAGAPPAYPTTTNGTLVFFRDGVPSGQVIPAGVGVNEGEWVGVLGAAGDASIMHNSYGSGPYATSILGKSVTLTRFITQTNIASNQGVAPVSASTGSLGRVEMWADGVVLEAAGDLTTGSAVSFRLSAPKHVGRPYVMASSLSAGPTPIGERSIGLGVDALFFASTSNALPDLFVNYTGTIGASGRANAMLNMPNYGFLRGIEVFSAFVTVDPNAPLGFESISNTHRFTIQ